jgi:hypothetical protein
LARDLQTDLTGRRAGLGAYPTNPPALRGIMFNRILFSTLAAAALLTAAPAFAADGGASKQSCSCCSDGSMHGVDHHLREEKQKAAAQSRQAEENPDIRNQSFGG